MVVGQLVPSNLFLNRSAATRHRHLLCVSANDTTSTNNTDNGSPFSSFGRLKAQKVKTLLVHRRGKDQSHRRPVHLEDDDDYVATPRPRRSQSRTRGGERWDMIPNYTPPAQSKSVSDTKFFSLKSFKEIGCSEYMIESLQKLLFSRPSHVQAMAFTPVISGKTCVIADQSGSGKTFAYLAPIIQRLRQQELEGIISKSSSQAPSPRVLVLAPTAELASQVLDNCRSLSKSGVPFKSMVVTGGFRQKTQLENLQQGVDVLIATPGRFLFLIHEGFLQLTNLRW